MRVTVLTTSYPRDADDVAGTFVRDGVEALRADGLEVRVVSPADFRHYGIAYGDGIVNNLRAAPWKLLALPLFLLGFARAARRASRDADVVHAHWLPSALPALATGKPFVLQLWGSDVALARRVRPLARLLVRRARIVVVASTALAEDARALGARDVRVVPSGVRIPDDGLCAGRAAAPPLRRAPLGGEGRARARGGRTWPAARRRRRRAAPCAVPAGGRVRASARGRRLLRAGRGRRGAVAPGGLRRHRPRGDGVRAAGGRDPRSAGSWTRSRTASRGCSSRRATSRPCAGTRGAARRRRAPRRLGRPRRARLRGVPRAYGDGRGVGAAYRDALARQSTRQRRSVRSTRSPSSVVSFLPSSRERALYVIGTS